MPPALISICAYPLCPITTHLPPVQCDKGPPSRPECNDKAFALWALHEQHTDTGARQKDRCCVQNINGFQFSKQCLFFNLLLSGSSKFIVSIPDSHQKICEGSNNCGKAANAPRQHPSGVWTDPSGCSRGWGVWARRETGHSRLQPPAGRRACLMKTPPWWRTES